MDVMDELASIFRPGALRELVNDSRVASSADSEPSVVDKYEKDASHSIIFEEVCHYCIPKSPIFGTLTLTTEALTFEPDARDANVKERGCSYYQMHLDIFNIQECGMIGVSEDDLSNYDRGSMHCNGLLQILLKPTARNSMGQQSTEDSPSSSSDEPNMHVFHDGDHHKGHREHKSMGLVSQGISRLSYVVNMAGFQMGPKLPSEKSSHTAAPPMPKKAFVVFAFFKKEVAHKCTLALMDALDAAKRRANVLPMRQWISSVPFLSNSLLDMLTETARGDGSGSNQRRSRRSRKLSQKNVPPVTNMDEIVESEKKLRERVAQQSRILTFDMVAQLIESLPPALAIRNWDLAFKTSHDGVSFSTMYKNMQGHEHCLLVVKDDRGGVFGAFTGHIELSYRFYGTSETFVFKFVDRRLKVYHAKGNNKCFIYSNENSIVIGGGADSALSIHDAFQSGTSGVSDTFGNESLSHSFVFNIEEMEIWTFGNYLV